MQKVDFILVGQGLAGTALAQQLLKANKSFVIVDAPDAAQSSRVAGGIWNPVVLKRFKKVWLADEMLEAFHLFFDEADATFGVKTRTSQSVLRLFANEREVNDWIELCDQPVFEKLLSPEIYHPTNTGLKAPFGLGFVTMSGRVDTAVWLDAAKDFFEFNGMFREDKLLVADLQITADHIVWKDVSARDIVFCEGMHTVFNEGFFKQLKFAISKGELLEIYAPALHLKHIVNGSVFILPMGKDVYRVGSTYSWHPEDVLPTAEAREELETALQKIIQCDYKIISQIVGIRPTVEDRKPLMGTHPDHKNVHIFNGMGSRGVLMAPYLAQLFVSYLLDGVALPKDINVARYF